MSREQTDAFESALDQAISSFGIEPLTADQTARLVRHYSMLCRWNQRLNLTRITAPREAARRHYAESLFGARFIAGEHTLLDVGSGAARRRGRTLIARKPRHYLLMTTGRRTIPCPGYRRIVQERRRIRSFGTLPPMRE